MHELSGVIAQTPAIEQHAPVGRGQRFGLQVPRSVQEPLQLDALAVIEQLPVLQHAPWHTGPLQVVPAPRKLPGQALSGVIVHNPTLVQQAPDGRGQGLGLHTAKIVHVPLHWAEVEVIVQFPLLQQVPAQMGLEHTDPSPRYVPGHKTLNVIMHAPSPSVQHPPSGGHPVGLHTGTDTSSLLQL